ncbi:MAG: S-methyl-5-thioribose-1-phosphate isomerase, partial [Nitrospirae bacterium]
GAPAIGIAAAMGVALGAQSVPASDSRMFLHAVEDICRELAATRPTAVNLFWALERMKRVAYQARDSSVAELQARLVQEACAILDEDLAMNKAIGAHGASLIQTGQRILTHCNAGALATGGYGTALGVIRRAWEEGKAIHVFADETRPVLQGARLTAWELHQDGIPVTVLTDNAAGALMAQGLIDLCLVGADRIAANGDVANKIGTYSVALLARAHGLPFYVAAPSSTIDFNIPSGRHIPIEHRPDEEVIFLDRTRRIVPDGVPVINPAFDVTPAEYITAIITEHGIYRPMELCKQIGRSPEEDNRQ